MSMSDMFPREEALRAAMKLNDQRCVPGGEPKEADAVLEDAKKFEAYLKGTP